MLSGGSLAVVVDVVCCTVEHVQEGVVGEADTAQDVVSLDWVQEERCSTMSCGVLSRFFICACFCLR